MQLQLPAAGLCEDFFARLSDLFSVTFSHFVYSDYGRCGLKDELLEHPITVQVLPQVSFWGFCEVSDIWNCIFFCIWKPRDYFNFPHWVPQPWNALVAPCDSCMRRDFSMRCSKKIIHGALFLSLCISCLQQHLSVWLWVTAPHPTGSSALKGTALSDDPENKNTSPSSMPLEWKGVLHIISAFITSVTLLTAIFAKCCFKAPDIGNTMGIWSQCFSLLTSSLGLR